MRWITNTQVKIKSEVADSNRQAADISRLLDGFERQISHFLNPSIDKQVTKVLVITLYLWHLQHLQLKVSDLSHQVQITTKSV